MLRPLASWQGESGEVRGEGGRVGGGIIPSKCK